MLNQNLRNWGDPEILGEFFSKNLSTRAGFARKNRPVDRSGWTVWTRPVDLVAVQQQTADCKEIAAHKRIGMNTSTCVHE